jgi:cytochrome c-type biogenesis protein CcmH/NrfG
MSSAPDPVGTLEVAVRHLRGLLRTRPDHAVEQAQEILKVVPTHAETTMLLGLAFAATGRGDKALGALRRATQLDPTKPDAWRALGDHLAVSGDPTGADAAYAHGIRTSNRDPRLMQAAAALCANEIPSAETLLREHLKQHPTDVAAMRMLAEVAARLQRYADAEKLLAHCLTLAPSFNAARHNLAIVLLRRHQPAAALREVETLIAAEPGSPSYQNLKAAILTRIGEFGESLEIYAQVLEAYPSMPKVWMSYGHALASASREQDSIAAYRRGIALEPNVGEPWWSLANLKTFRFTPDEIAQMRRALERADLTAEDRFHFHFALGKALEDAGEYAESFRHYADGNALRRAGVQYSADDNTEHTQRSKALFTAEYFALRPGYGCQAPDPIFIVGLPRAGSTLIEQILASHSQVEGTMELPDVIAITRSLGGWKSRDAKSRYPELLAGLSAAECAALGERYLEQSRIQRKTAKPFFIDKMPNNFVHTGFIHLVLPNAKIIDARRHPLGCCFSAFKQHFARGQHYTYSLDEIGAYYRDYVALMAHFDSVLPGRVHRVLYEDMIDDTESEVRSLLDYCGLPFEEACLRFYETDRAVRTASSQQVRQPIYTGGKEHWRHYEPWLDPLKRALGAVLDAYPDAPRL